MTTKKRKRWIWAGLGLIAITASRLGDLGPDKIEVIYGLYIFPSVRWTFLHTLSLLPFPALWLVVVLVLLLAWRTIVLPVVKRDWTWRSFLWGVVSTSGAVIFLFYSLWGFNYKRPAVAERLGLEAPPLDSAALRQEFYQATRELTHVTLENDQELSTRISNWNPRTERALDSLLRTLLEEFDYPLSSPARGRRLGPEGILLRFSTAGIYIPFSGEGHVDRGLLPVQIPFTMCHEQAHGYGIAGEGDCNFLAYLSLIRSNDPLIRFTGYLTYWRYIASDYRRFDPDDFAEAYETLPQTVHEINDAIRENNAKYPDIMPRLRNRVYDTYLKSHGMKEGLRSYRHIVRMVYVWRQAQSEGD